MLKSKFLILFFIFSAPAFAQVNAEVIIEKEPVLKELDSVKMDTILLNDVSFSKVRMSPEEKKEFLTLQNRVLKVYPYAKIAAERLSLLNKNMENLQSNKEKRRYFKLAEDYLNNEFKDKLKKLSHKQGQILVKLIYRQTGVSTYNLIKDYKSGWKAFWSNNAAYFFKINLKEIYDPHTSNEDYLIETILYRAFSTGRLQEQKSANPIEIDALNEHWEKLATKINKKK
jgi:hypothetical protein